MPFFFFYSKLCDILFVHLVLTNESQTTDAKLLMDAVSLKDFICFLLSFISCAALCFIPLETFLCHQENKCECSLTRTNREFTAADWVTYNKCSVWCFKVCLYSNWNSLTDYYLKRIYYKGATVSEFLYCKLSWLSSLRTYSIWYLNLIDLKNRGMICLFLVIFE